MSESKQQSLPPGYQLEEYKIIRELGSGGFGITYLARDLNLEREVVIKENLPLFAFRDPSTSTVHPKSAVGEDKDLFKWSLESFVREARTLAKFDHPNIVRVLRVFHANNTAYFVMPYVEGRTFSEWITERKKTGETFEEAELRDLLLPLLDALEVLHGQQVYHRDIKPGNVLVTSRGTPMLIDFGAARQMVSERSHTVVESPGYTPFEQLQSRGNVGPWSDLYGLAATFYKALTFENPPKANDRVKKDAIRKLGEDSALRARFSLELLTGLDAALAFDEENRPQTAGEMVEMVEMVEEESELEKITAVETVEEEKPRVSTVPPKRGEQGRERLSAWAKTVMIIGVVGVFLVGLVTMMAIKGSSEPTADTPMPAEHGISEAEGMKLRAELAAEKKAREEAEMKAAIAMAVTPSVPSVPITSTPKSPPAPAPAFPASRGMEGSRAGEMREFGGIEVVWCPPTGPEGFLMGSPDDETNLEDKETQHRVSLTKGFWLAKTETTQGQWQDLMGSNPSYFKGGNLPVETVSWEDVEGWLEKMNSQNALPSGWKWFLPTEAQWEYACRAGTETAFSFGSMLNGKEANCDGNYPYGTSTKGPYLEKTMDVESYAANAWGLYDMHGNVREWCADYYGDYPSGSATDPKSATTGSRRVLRGGSWDGFAEFCRSAFRDWDSPGYRGYDLGFRVAAVPVGR